jgi:hypothetical protein
LEIELHERIENHGNQTYTVVQDSGSTIFLSILLTLPTAVIAADTYPTKTIRLIVPFAAGGGTDLVGRIIAPRLSERLGKPVIVENRGGAGPVLGTALAPQACSRSECYWKMLDDKESLIQNNCNIDRANENNNCPYPLEFDVEAEEQQAS